jgi:glycine cleavage system regulatory protein
MKNVMGITDVLCQALQQKSQDILNAKHLVTSTKTLIQKLRDDGWETLLEEVTSFCKHQDIEVPHMDACFSSVEQSRRKTKSVTVEHHDRVDIFTAIIDQQLQELNNRFNEQAIELLKLSTTLDPRNSYKLFNVKDICLLANKFYPQDFSNQEKIHLRFQLQHYELDVPNHPKLKNMSSIADLCQGLVENRKINNLSTH